MNIKIIKGYNKLEKELNNVDFLNSWKKIAHSNKHVTLMQEPDFVVNWYKNYNENHLCFLVLGYNKTDLIGIIPLALRENLMIHAGGMQAEYHGWICKKEFEQEFLIDSLRKLKKEFNLKKWEWGWVPPQSETSWIDSKKLKRSNIYFKREKQKSPILNLNDDQKINKLKKSRSLKTKINRYKKRGDFYLKRITTRAEALKLMPLIEKQFDFRKIHMDQDPLFIKDSNKRNFILDKINNTEHVHFTVLMLNKTPVAFHIGECDKSTVYLTMISHDAVEARNSPGKILLIKLIELLKEEGYNFFDLTPGGDSYKESYANKFNNLSYLTIYFNIKDKIISDVKDYIKESSKSILKAINIEPHIISEKASKFIGFFRKNPIKTISKEIHSKNISLFYKLPLNESLIKTSINENININSYQDFLIELDEKNWESKRSEFSKIQKHFNLGNKLHTILEDNTLMYSGWIIKKQLTLDITELEKLNIKKESIFIGDFQPSSKYSDNSFLKALIKRMLVDCYEEGINEIFIELKNEDESIKKAIEEIGFEYYKKREIHKILGVKKIKIAS